MIYCYDLFYRDEDDFELFHSTGLVEGRSMAKVVKNLESSYPCIEKIEICQFVANEFMDEERGIYEQTSDNVVENGGTDDSVE